MFAIYKYYIMAGLLAAYSFGVWHVASTYTEASALEAQVEMASKNAITKEELVKAMEEKLAVLRPQTTVINRNINNEILKDTVYLDCKSNPNVMREYQHKLDLQPK